MRTQAGDAPPPPVGCLLSGILPNFVSFQPSLIIQIHWPSSITMSLPWKLPFFSQWKENSPFLICPGDASFFFRSGSHFAFYYTCCFVQSLSRVWLFATPWTAACQPSLSITNFQSLLKLMSIELVMTSNHLILCYPLLLPPSVFPSIRVFSNESVLHIDKVLEFQLSISPSNEYSGLISFRVD